MFNAETIQSLNDLDLEVYNYVIRQPEKVQYMRIREFAEEAHVSTSTVLRFCKKVGCDGYAEFKLKLRQYLNESHQPTVKDDISEVIDFLKKTCSDTYDEKLEELTQVILNAHHIFFVGSGMSGIVAKYGARYFPAWENSACTLMNRTIQPRVNLWKTHWSSSFLFRESLMTPSVMCCALRNRTARS